MDNGIRRNDHADGNVIIVRPAAGDDAEAKLQKMRGNNFALPHYASLYVLIMLSATSRFGMHRSIA